ncbi:SufE family protein [Shewanella sp. 202IG2-18]|uniref:SufE family protein n=1 Tax=Parashewanella hymeniacidonis TaxID=2807618 RepID=UPI00195FE2C2|nr:SufE family protein [Parashewanella hymeniacidonis]MBM7072323.1 SufE family protein [Parashewanella hymeniacidonis]
MPEVSPKTQDYQYQVPQLDEIKQVFSAAKNWQEKYRQLMILGKKTPRLGQEYKITTALIDGCESDAWLYHQVIDGKHYFIADSDARIVKGLIVILLSVFHQQQQKPDESIQELFTELGLYTQLSPSRTNGLTALSKSMAAVF